MKKNNQSFILLYKLFDSDVNQKMKVKQHQNIFPSLENDLAKIIKTKKKIHRLIILNFSSFESSFLTTLAHKHSNGGSITHLITSIRFIDYCKELPKYLPFNANSHSVYGVFEEHIDPTLIQYLEHQSFYIIKREEGKVRLVPDIEYGKVAIDGELINKSTQEASNIKTGNYIYGSKVIGAYLFGYQGKIVLLPKNDIKGVIYIANLLTKYYKEISYLHLYYQGHLPLKKRGTESSNQVNKQEEINLIDNKALNEIRIRIATINRELNRTEIISASKITDLELEKQKLENYLKSNVNVFGVSRKTASDTKKLNKTTKQAIELFLKLLKKYHYNDFHDYLLSRFTFESDSVISSEKVLEDHWITVKVPFPL